MKIKSFILLTICVVLLLTNIQAQVIETFEGGLPSGITAKSDAVENGSTNHPECYSFVANPAISPVNTSANCIKITHKGYTNWGSKNTFGVDIPLNGEVRIYKNGSKHYLHFKYFTNTPGAKVGILLTDGVNVVQNSFFTDATLTSQWVDAAFEINTPDFNVTNLTKIFLIPDYGYATNNRTTDVIVYMDDIQVTKTSGLDSPPVDITYGSLVLSPLTLVYNDINLPYTMDASWATLKNGDETVTFFETAMGKSPYYYRHKGTYDKPLQTVLTPFKWDYNGFNNTWPSGNWLDNIYKVSKDTLIGFIHREHLYPANRSPYGTNQYYIGIARSFDGGNNWKYLGDVVGTVANAATTQTYSPNSAGLPILKVGDYIHIYFDEWGEMTSTYRTGICVARAKLTDLIAAIKQDKNCEFLKYKDGLWTENGMTGIGSNVIPDFRTYFDTHGDAVYCKPLNKYLMTIQTYDDRHLYLYQSTDGIITTGVPTVNAPKFSIYPNPATEVINIVGAANSKLSMYSCLGQNVLKKDITDNNQSIKLGNISKGIYILEVTSKDGVSSSQKVNIK